MFKTRLRTAAVSDMQPRQLTRPRLVEKIGNMSQIFDFALISQAVDELYNALEEGIRLSVANLRTGPTLACPGWPVDACDWLRIQPRAQIPPL